MTLSDLLHWAAMMMVSHLPVSLALAATNLLPKMLVLETLLANFAGSWLRNASAMSINLALSKDQNIKDSVS